MVAVSENESFAAPRYARQSIVQFVPTSVSGILSALVAPDAGRPVSPAPLPVIIPLAVKLETDCRTLFVCAHRSDERHKHCAVAVTQSVA